MTNNIEYFNNKLNESLSELNDSLVDGFVAIFGDFNRSKIIDVIKNINVGIFGPNLSFQELEEKIKYYSNMIEQIKNEQKIPDENNKVEELCSKYAYYKKLRDSKKNNDDNFVLLYSNTPNYDEDFNEFVNYYINCHKATAGTGGVIKHAYLGMTVNSECKIRLRVIIHEIIHILMVENLLIYNDDNILTTSGRITEGKSQYKVVNELFVEYFTNEVLNNILLNSKLNNNSIFDLNFTESRYMKIDKLCNNVGKRIFELLKTILKKKFINGEDAFIIRIIGSEQLFRLEYFMDKILEKHLQFSSDTPVDVIFSVEEQREFKEYSDIIYQEIENNYNEYLEVCKLEDEYVTKLEEQGLVRRV